MPENQGFCGAGEASNGAGGAGIFVLPYQVGDRVLCYPTMEHESNDWKVKSTIISIEYEQGYILTCTVNYKNRKKEDKTAVIAGGKSDWLLRRRR